MEHDKSVILFALAEGKTVALARLLATAHGRHYLREQRSALNHLPQRQHILVCASDRAFQLLYMHHIGSKCLLCVVYFLRLSQANIMFNYVGAKHKARSLSASLARQAETSVEALFNRHPVMASGLRPNLRPRITSAYGAGAHSFDFQKKSWVGIPVISALI